MDTSNTIQINCPNCGIAKVVKPQDVGRMATCACGETFRVTAPSLHRPFDFTAKPRPNENAPIAPPPVKSLSPDGVFTEIERSLKTTALVTNAARWVIIGCSLFCLMGVGMTMLGEFMESIRKAANPHSFSGSSGSAMHSVLEFGYWIGLWMAVSLPSFSIWFLTQKR